MLISPGLSIKKMYFFKNLYMECFVGWYFQSSLFLIHSYNLFKSNSDILDMHSFTKFLSAGLYAEREGSF